MFGLSTWEVLIILVVALIFIGPDQLPKVARKLGDGMRQVRGAMTRVDDEVRRTIREVTSDEALAEDDARRAAAEARAASPATAVPPGVAQIAGANADPASLPALEDPGPETDAVDASVVAAPAAVPEPAADDKPLDEAAATAIAPRKAPAGAVPRRSPFSNAKAASEPPASEDVAAEAAPTLPGSTA